ncbi:MAG: hypothetical protein D6812_01105 [Deltaproteobacteria bacterium]|nr:MAG: hypothetical protein D6812_01105 [Deltaproteobacteria bacterium]
MSPSASDQGQHEPPLRPPYPLGVWIPLHFFRVLLDCYYGVGPNYFGERREPLPGGEKEASEQPIDSSPTPEELGEKIREFMFPTGITMEPRGAAVPRTEGDGGPKTTV